MAHVGPGETRTSLGELAPKQRRAPENLQEAAKPQVR